jgi:hypothetical protein
MKDEIPVNAKTLAEKLNRTPFYIHAMKTVGGYEFSHGNRTMVSHALKWLKDHPAFRSTGYRWKQEATEGVRTRRPRLQPVTADMSDELTR